MLSILLIEFEVVLSARLLLVKQRLHVFGMTITMAQCLLPHNQDNQKIDETVLNCHSKFSPLNQT